MATIRKNITFTEQLNSWVQLVVAQGDYANESEYVRDLIRHDKQKRARQIELQEAINEGLNSGVSAMNVDDVWREAEERYKKKNV